jgi:hypothetical protein
MPAARPSVPVQQSGEAAVQMLHLAARCVVGSFLTALLYKVGAIHVILPKPIVARLESAVESIKSKTEPKKLTKMFATTRLRLLRTYGLTAALWGCSAMGTLTFFANPYIPIAVPIVANVASAGVVLATTPEMVATEGRIASALVASYTLGYAFGPMNWVGYDSLAPFAVVVASTLGGFSIPLFLTRGSISYFLSTQLLSSSLSICGMMALSQGGVPADVNVMLTLQVIANVLLGLGHTIPVLSASAARAPQSPTQEEDSQAVEGDVVKEALKLYGASAYIMWRTFKFVCMFAVRRVFKEDPGVMTKEEKRKLKNWSDVANRTTLVSDVLASGLFLLTYIKVVSVMQQSTAGKSLNSRLDSSRKILAALSPITLIQRL